MKRVNVNLIIFSIGAFGYGLLEILWRGYTHWSMLCAGGISLCGLSVIAEKFKRVSKIIKAVLGGVFITVVEFLFGVVFNILLRKNVWDYSKMPFNLYGQICAVYSLFWILISFITLPLVSVMNKKLKN